MYKPIKQVHFVGIGGIGMSGLAEILLTMGCRVTGSDCKPSALIARLRRRGAKISLVHQASNVGDVQAVVVSSANPRSHVELEEAGRRGIPVIARAQMLAELMRLKYGIAVAGSHGKTTTTSLTAAILTEGGLDPTIVIGGRVKSFRSNARLGKGDFLVTEADESDGSFLHLSPSIAVITNIDAEHLDHYRDFEALKKTFSEFVSQIPFYGVSVLCADDPVVSRLKPPGRVVSYGLDQPADITARRLSLRGLTPGFDVLVKGENLGAVTLNLPGRHNVLNSLAAIAVGLELGIPFSAIKRALKGFQGVHRRMERLHQGEITVIDDYGHHPTEIKATLAALRSVWKKNRLWVVFQPHRYTRLKLLFQEFLRCFARADRVVVLPIYAAGEEPIRGVTSELFARELKKRSKQVDLETPASLADRLLPRLQKGDVVVTMGAGDVTKLGHELAGRLKNV